MSKVLIECESLIDKYKLDKEAIIEQLKRIKVEENKNFVTAYEKKFKYTLIGETKLKDNSVVLTNIKEAIDYKKTDNSDIFNILNK